MAAKRFDGREVLLGQRRRRTLACGEERPAALIVDLGILPEDVPPETARAPTPAELNFIEALDKVDACDHPSSWNDHTQDAFNALRKSVAHLPAEALDRRFQDAGRILIWLAHTFRCRSMQRNLVVALLQRLLSSSSSWKCAAETELVQEQVRAVAVELHVSAQSLGALKSLGEEKAAQFFLLFGIRLDSLQAPSEAQHNVHNLQPSCCRQLLKMPRNCVAAIVLATLAMLMIFSRSGASTCKMLQCPANYISKVGHHFCSGPVCLDVCCDRKATCETFRCPTTSHRLKGNATSISCSGVRCLPSDLRACCDAIALCSSFECPQWYRSRADSMTTACLSSECTAEADLEKCCELSSLQSLLANAFACPTCSTSWI